MMEKQLVTRAPTDVSRKVWAAFVAAIAVNTAVAVLDYFLPGVKDAIPATQWITELTMLLSMYMVRDSVPMPPKEG